MNAAQVVEPESANPAQFTTTHWSVVLTDGLGESAPAQTALEALCRAYWYPITFMFGAKAMELQMRKT